MGDGRFIVYVSSQVSILSLVLFFIFQVRSPCSSSHEDN